MRNRTKLVAAVFAAVAVAMLAYAVLTGEPTEDVDDRMGMWDRARAYSTTDLTAIIVASFLIAVAVMFILLREEYEPLPPHMAPPPPTVPVEEPEGPAATTGEVAPVPERQGPPQDLGAEENYLVLRLLTGDERTMFKTIMDSGGEALQKDLIARTKMSNAKVSRVLEKLERKGVVSKERHGSTNKVRITLRT